MPVLAGPFLGCFCRLLPDASATSININQIEMKAAIFLEAKSMLAGDEVAAIIDGRIQQALAGGAADPGAMWRDQQVGNVGGE